MKETVLSLATTKNEQLNGTYPVTQFTRAMKELGIEVICANLPQAKGRVERSFNTFQDRLVKENKLLGITDKEAGNKHLPTYTKEFNKKFTVESLNKTDVHQKRPGKQVPDKNLCIQEQRKIAKDFTVRYHNKIFQILREQKVVVLTRSSVTIETRLDGSIHLRYKDTYLKYVDITDNIRLKQHYCRIYQ